MSVRLSLFSPFVECAAVYARLAVRAYAKPEILPLMMRRIDMELFEKFVIGKK